MRVRPRPLRGGARVHRGRGADPEARLRPRLTAEPTRDHPVRLARETRIGRAPRKALATGSDRRRRPRDADLHIGHDRAAQGLHAHAPQPRGRRDARRGRNEPAGRHLSPLPADGPQLRPARAPGRDESRDDARARLPPSCRPFPASTRRFTRTRSARSSAPAACGARSASGRWA
jgi:hypothetical protein